jgi:hypothetical protein
MNRDKFIDAIIEEINSLDNEYMVELNNTYCEQQNYPDDRIYNNDDSFLDENFSSVNDAVRAVSYGEYKYSDKYVKFNGYGNLESFTHLTDADLCEHASTIAEHVADNYRRYEHIFSLDESDFEDTDDETDEDDDTYLEP